MKNVGRQQRSKIGWLLKIDLFAKFYSALRKITVSKRFGKLLTFLRAVQTSSNESIFLESQPKTKKDFSEKLQYVTMRFSLEFLLILVALNVFESTDKQKWKIVILLKI